MIPLSNAVFMMGTRAGVLTLGNRFTVLLDHPC